MADRERFLLKDMIDEPSVRAVFEAVGTVVPGFDVGAALRDVFDEDFPSRELKQRIRHVATVLRTHVGGTYREALQSLQAATPGIRGAGFAAMALNDFVEEYGTDDFEASVPALAMFTRLASAEFAVRPFLRSDPERMLAVMASWARTADPALRRLASEGSRPRLPWGMGLPGLKADPSPTRPILEQLRHDPSEEVRRSVANHLNDIAKDHPAYVVALLTEWQDGSTEIAEITRHGLRTLVKQGNPAALGLLGFRPGVPVDVVGLRVEPDSVAVGGSTRARWQLVNRDTDAHDVMVDYAVSYHRAGKRPTRKVFKGGVVSLQPGQDIPQHRKVSLAPMSTRRIEAGPHTVEVQVNGDVKASVEFDVVDA